MAVIYLPKEGPNPYLYNATNTMMNYIAGMGMRKAEANIRAKEQETRQKFVSEERTKSERFQLQKDGYSPMREMSVEHGEAADAGNVVEGGGGVWKGPEVGEQPLRGGGSVVTYGGKPFKIREPEGAGKTAKPVSVKMGDKIVTYLPTNDPANNYLGIPGAKKVSEADRYKQGDVNVNVDMTKKSQADLEGKIIHGEATLAKLDRVMDLYDPNFLEWTGKGKAFLNDKASKAGLNTSKWFDKYNKWKAEVAEHTLMWRKLITGVAGSEREMEAIEKTTINTNYDSPASFKAKSAQIRVFTEAAIKRSKYLLSRGFDVSKMPEDDPTRKRLFEDNPLEEFGYKDADIPAGRNSGIGDYEVGEIYEDANGAQMRLDSYDKNGNPIWTEP